MSRLVEEWRPAKYLLENGELLDYSECYSVSNYGRVWSHHRKKFMGYSIHPDGYFRAKLSKNGGYIQAGVHRIVASTFLEIPEELKQFIGTTNLKVNHKDEDPQNNYIENLEWCTTQYNNTYRDRHLKCANKIKKKNTEKSGKPVKQYTLNGELVAEYPSTWEASRQTGFTKQGIMIACHGGQMKKNKWVNTFQYKGFIWKYA